MTNSPDKPTTLTEHGWRVTASGRYWHPDMPPLEGGRRRLYTEGEALTLTDAFTDEATCPDCGSEECPGARAQAGEVQA